MLGTREASPDGEAQGRDAGDQRRHDGRAVDRGEQGAQAQQRHEASAEDVSGSRELDRRLHPGARWHVGHPEASPGGEAQGRRSDGDQRRHDGRAVDRGEQGAQAQQRHEASAEDVS
ncbi:hypothetical protein, partial [Streptomyces shenzhenensis]|uniref:hypothetical protein n=1 Tax=Streptomyces shenzhenensis TaxID=943815 RepID=UPI003697FD85